MKQRKRVTGAVMAVLFVAGLLAGCMSDSNSDATDKDGNRTDGNGQPAANNSYGKHLDLSIAYFDIATGIKEGQSDAVLKRIEDKFNITIKPVNETWRDYEDRTKLWAASGQLPDAFATDNTSGDLFNQWVEQGIIKPLPDDMSRYPHLQAYLELPDVAGAEAADGNNYFIPRMLGKRNELPTDRGILIRKDWMEELGLADPHNFEELKQLLRTLAEKKHVIGITSNNIDWMHDSVFHNLAPAAGWWQKIDGRWQPGYMTDAYADVVAHERDLYKAGLLDQDFSIPNMDAEGKFLQGKAAALVTTVKTMNALSIDWKAANPGTSILDHVKILPPVPAADGSNYLYGYFDYWSGTLFNGNISDEKQQRILALLDFLASPEGQKLSFYGIEGVDWEPKGDKIVNLHADDPNFDLARTYPSTTVFNGLSIWTDGVRYVEGYGNTEVERVQKYIDGFEADQLATGKKAPVNWVVNAYAMTQNTGGGDLDGLVTKLVIGNDDIKSSLRKFADEQMSLGLKEAIDHVNAKFGHVD